MEGLKTSIESILKDKDNQEKDANNYDDEMKKHITKVKNSVQGTNNEKILN